MSPMMHITPSLLHLPEDVIYEILLFLDATSLYLVAQTCTTLAEIVRNRKVLWRLIDARRPPNDTDKIVYCLDRAYEATHTLLLRGDRQSVRLSPLFLPKLEDFSSLAVLACENQIIDGTNYDVTVFPRQLIELSFKRTLVTKPLEFFKGSGGHFKKLKVLILDQCPWLNSSAFMPISKYVSLEVLSVYKCENLENTIAYLALASQGFKNLKILDARLSPLGNTLVRSMQRLRSLLAIYLQNQDRSYKLDYMRRRLQILQGAPWRDYLADDDEFGKADMVDDFKNFSEDESNCDDTGFVDYVSVESEVRSLKFPQSVLYVDPYGTTCTCGREEPRAASRITNDGGDSDDDDDDDDDDDAKGDGTSISELKRCIETYAKIVRRGSWRERGLPERRSTPIAGHFDGHSTDTVLFNTDGYDSDENRPVIRLYLFPRATAEEDASSASDLSYPSDDSDYAPFSDQHAKRRRPDDASSASPRPKRQRHDDDNDEEAGPSGANAARPPTPRPDVADEPSPASFRIFFRNSPSAQIENVDRAQKNVRVPLRRLSLRGYVRVTNATLRYIDGLELDVLDVTHTRVTVEGVRKYLTSHPLCRVVHEEFCTCLPNMHF